MNTTIIQRVLTITAFLLCSLRAFAAPPIDPSNLEDKVTITVGQKLAIQFQSDGDALKKPKMIEQPDAKSPSVALDFGKHDSILILSIKNSFSRALRCRCLMRLKGQKEYSETSILPIMAGLADYESWGDPIEEIVLFDFKLTDEKPPQ